MTEAHTGLCIIVHHEMRDSYAPLLLRDGAKLLGSAEVIGGKRGCLTAWGTPTEVFPVRPAAFGFVTCAMLCAKPRVLNRDIDSGYTADEQFGPQTKNPLHAYSSRMSPPDKIKLFEHE
eukprot:9220944-Pyramimonas_sp.AAC.2